jgi:hypothetical protein
MDSYGFLRILNDSYGFMQCVGEAGLHYGLQFNWSKLEAMPVNCVASLAKPDGTFVREKESMVYLGSLLSSDGRIGSELGRRIGAARAVFDRLTKVWAHATISRVRKLRVFQVCVESKLLFNIHAAWLNVSERRRLDAFQAKCLRKVIGVKPSFISRVSNEEVRTRANCRPLSSILTQRQLMLMGRLAARPDTDIMRQSVFSPGAFEPRKPVGRRRRGRPRNIWTTAVFQLAIGVAGTKQALLDLWQNTSAAKAAWQDRVQRSCR